MKSLNQLIKSTFVFVTLSMISITCGEADAQNPLLNTEWTGIARIPEESEILLKFSDDQLDVVFENRVIESMKYSLKDNHITLEKISGGSPCELGLKGEYKYEVIGNSFAINLVKDDCASRTASLKENVFTRISTN